MIRFFSLVGAVLGAWGGWRLGMHAGVVTAYFAGVFGAAAGIFFGRRLAENLLE
jgi:hypothetical protein